jgi:hypothetical protein
MVQLALRLDLFLSCVISYLFGESRVVFRSGVCMNFSRSLFSEVVNVVKHVVQESEFSLIYFVFSFVNLLRKTCTH